MKIKHIAFLLIICFSCLASQSVEELKRITLKEAIDIAIDNSIDLQAEKLNIQIAKNNIKRSNRLQNPDVTNFWNIGTAGSGNPQMIGVTQMLEILKRKYRKNTAGAELKVSEEKAGYSNFDLKLDVREAYINLVSAKSVLESLETEEKSLVQINNLVKLRYKNGTASQTDLIQANISLNQVRTQVNTARTNIMAARFAFNSVMDTDPIYGSVLNSFEDDENFDKLLTPSPKTTLPDFNEILAIAQQNRYDLKIAQKEIDVAKNNLKMVASQRIPDLELQGGYMFQSRGMSEDGKFQNGAYAGISLVNLPILYNYSPEINNAKLEIEKAELKYAAAQNNAYANLSSAYEKLVNAKLNLNYYTDSLIEDSKHMMRTSKKNYEDGKGDLTSLIVIEQSYRSIIIGYTYALTQYYSCWINFLREVNIEELPNSVNL